jgi:hypothetical protein
MIVAQHTLLVGQQRLVEHERGTSVAGLAGPVGDVVAGRERIRVVGLQVAGQDRSDASPRRLARTRQNAVREGVVKREEARPELADLEQSRLAVFQQNARRSTEGPRHLVARVLAPRLVEPGRLLLDQHVDHRARLVLAVCLLPQIGEQRLLHLGVEAVRRTACQDVRVVRPDQVVKVLDRDVGDHVAVKQPAKHVLVEFQRQCLQGAALARAHVAQEALLQIVVSASEMTGGGEVVAVPSDLPDREVQRERMVAPLVAGRHAFVGRREDGVAVGLDDLCDAFADWVAGVLPVPVEHLVEKALGVVQAQAADAMLFDEHVPGIFGEIVALVVKVAPANLAAPEQREAATRSRFTRCQVAAQRLQRRLAVARVQRRRMRSKPSIRRHSA